MIFVQQMQYKSNRMYVFQNFSGFDTQTSFWCWDPDSGPLPSKILAARLVVMSAMYSTGYRRATAAQRITVAILAFRALNGQAPSFLSNIPFSFHWQHVGQVVVLHLRLDWSFLDIPTRLPKAHVTMNRPALILRKIYHCTIFRKIII